MNKLMNSSLKFDISTLGLEVQELVLLSNCECEKNNCDEAISYLRQAIDREANVAFLWCRLGELLHEAEKYDEELAAYEKAIEITPEDYQAWNGKGKALRWLDRREESIVAYQRAVEINSDNNEAWGILLSELELKVSAEIRESIASLKESIVSLPTRPDYFTEWYNQGDNLIELGRFEEAIASYDCALSIKPDDHGSWNNRGYALIELGRFEEAIASLDRALSIKSDYQLSLYNRGKALIALGRHEEGIASYERALSIKSDLYQVWYERGNALIELEKNEEAIASFECALSIKPDLYQAWSNRGSVLFDLGRFEEAIASYDRALSINPDFDYAWNGRGNALSNLGRFEEAIASYDHALSINPDFDYAWNGRGSALSNLGKNEEAISFYDRALSIKPDYYEAWRNRGIAAISSLKSESNIALFLPKGLAERVMGTSGTERALVCCDAGIAYSDSQSDYHIKSRGNLHYFKGNIYYMSGKGTKDYYVRFTNSVESYETALNEWKKDQYKYQFGEEYLEILFSLIRVCIALGDTDIAETLCREGTDLYERLLEISNPKRQEKLIRQFSGRFRDLTVSAYLLKGKLTEALEIAENDKNQCLAWLFSGNEIPVLGYSEMQELLDSKTAIIFWHISDYALTTFLLLPNATAPLGFSAFPVNGEPEFETWQRQWQTDHQTEVIEDSTANFPQWITGMTSRCDQLRELLNIDTIQIELDKYPEINQLLLVPHRTLHLYPLHSIFDPKYLITHVPSIQIALELKQRQQPQSTTSRQLLAIANPKHQIKTTDPTDELEITKKARDLRFAKAEGKAICQAIANSQLLTGETATLERLSQELSDHPTQILHFSCHAKHDPEKPENSQLYLSQNDTLTFKQIPSLPLSTCQLAYLSACETGMTANKTIRNEYIGLSSAFLYAGVPVIVSTLWSVEDVASALLSIAFYDRYLHPTTGGDAPLALRQAQAWLREFDRQEYERIYADPQWQQRLSASQWAEVQTSLNQSAKPYLSPYYWAGYYTVSFFQNIGD